MSWVAFLKEIASDYRLTPEQTDVFLERFDETNKNKRESEIQKQSKRLFGINPEAYIKRRGEIYKKFTYSYPELEKAGSHKAERLREWLEIKYSEQQQQSIEVSESPSPQALDSALEIPTVSEVAADAALIDWHHVCHEMLKTQQEKQKFRKQITGRGLGHEVNVYLPLGLVKPKEQPRRGEESQPSADRGMLQYQLTEKEIEQEYKHDEFLQQVIEGKEKNLAIVGEPGAGKSTWLEEIALYVDNPEKGFPICISLASLGGKTLEDYLLQNWLEDALRFTSPDVFEVTPALEKKLKKLFYSGKVWLLLDGVDEMRLRAYESPLQTIANQLRKWVDMARVVLTCRLNVWEANPNALPNFETYRTLHFDDEQVGQFIRDWFTKAGDPELGERLQDKLGESGQERIRDLIKNPLRLAMLCKTWYLTPGELPKTKVTLYQRFRDDFYNWKPHPLLTEDLDKQEELHAALSNLALEAIKKKSPLRKKFAYKVMGKPLFQLACDAGWLNWVYKDAETDEDVYAFFHLTFQEYFAAYAIDDWHFFLNHVPHNPKFGVYRIFEPQWREVILLWLGRVDMAKKQKEQFIQTLVEFDDEREYPFYWFHSLFLAAAGIVELADFSDCPLTEKILINIVALCFGYLNTNKKEWVTSSEPIAKVARVVLQETNHTEAVDALVWVIQNSQDVETKRQVVKSLGKIGKVNSRAVIVLVWLIQNSQDEETLRLTVQSLGEIGKGNQIAIDTLVWLLQNSQNEETLRLAAGILVKIGKGNQIAIDTLVWLLQNSQNEETLRLAADILGKIDKGNPIAIDTLAGLIQNSRNEETLRLALWSLGEIGNDNPIAADALVKLIHKSHDESFRKLAAESLVKIDPGNPIAVITLVKLVQTSQNEEIRCWGALRLWSTGKCIPLAVVALVELIQNSQDVMTCRLATNLLEKVGKGNSIAIAALVELSRKSQDEYIRMQTAECLGKIDTDSLVAVTILVELIENSQDENTRREAAESLGKVDKSHPLAADTLIKLIKNSQDESIRLLAVYSLEKLGKSHPEAVAAVIESIQNPQGGFSRRVAVDSLKTILREDQMAGVVTILKNYLSDRSRENDPWRFQNCYEAIWHCAQTMPYPEFYKAWHHPPLTPHPEVTVSLI